MTSEHSGTTPTLRRQALSADMNNHDLLDSVCAGCDEIRESLNSHQETTTNQQHLTDIEKDIVTLKNLKLIMLAVKEDMVAEMVGASTELLLRIAANDFKNKLAQIPEKKVLRKKLGQQLKCLHKDILDARSGRSGIRV